MRRFRRVRDDEESIQGALDEAEEALDAGDPESALHLADAAVDASRRLGDGALQAAGWLVRSDALLELGRASEAMRAATAAAESDPDDPAVHAAVGLAAHHCARFEESAQAWRRAVECEPGYAEAWHGLGRALVWLDDLPAADRALGRAADLAPEDFCRPTRIAAGEFDRLAADAYQSVPGVFRARLGNALVVVEPLPNLEDVAGGFDPDTLGVYEGSTALHADYPERIVLFQRNHETVCASLGALREEIRRTIVHEVGHHFGMSEGELPF